MPKKETDYSKAVIYKIQHNEKEELIYIGSTTDFHKRKYRHKINSIDGTATIYKLIREHGGWDCFRMIILKIFPCDNKVELHLEEDKLIREMKAIMNQKQSYGINWGKRIEDKKKYQEENKEYFSDLGKEKITCECGCILRKSDLKRHQLTLKHSKLLNK